jgi:hypothetical protein
MTNRPLSLRPLLGLPLLLALALPGCANGAADSAGTPAEPPASIPAATSAAPSDAPTESPSAGSTTITGTVVAGVEPNCLLLDDHLLIIKDPAQQSVAKVGATVTVTGRAEKNMMTTCQQGTPFIVATIRAN